MPAWVARAGDAVSRTLAWRPPRAWRGRKAAAVAATAAAAAAAGGALALRGGQRQRQSSARFEAAMRGEATPGAWCQGNAAPWQYADGQLHGLGGVHDDAGATVPGLPRRNAAAAMLRKVPRSDKAHVLRDLGEDLTHPHPQYDPRQTRRP